MARGRFFYEVGPFRVRLKSSAPALARFFHSHYAAFPQYDSGGFADFHIRIERPRSLRRWIRQQLLFFLDDHRPFHPYPHSMAVPLLEWGLNWCIAGHAHWALLIHSAVVERNGRACLLIGKPESGKSTLCALLIHRGWRLLSDEFALLDPSSGHLLPLPRPVSLKGSSIQVVQAQAPGLTVGGFCFNEGPNEEMAYVVPPPDAVRRMHEPAEPSVLVFPRFQSGKNLTVHSMPPSRTAYALAENAFNYSILGLEGFRLLAFLVEKCPAYELSYGEGSDVLDWFEALP
ncbi:HprK-related kinase A [Desulfacinum hydrothermale]|nr:HprK-related kinase A [Desulfacinum hydrothermale]